MVQCRLTHSVLLLGFLAAAFYGLAIRSHDVFTMIKSVDSMEYKYADYSDISEMLEINADYETHLFRDNLELVKLIGKGDVSYAFEARYKNKTVVAKFATDKDLYYSDIEIGVFRELNAAPSIPNIPQLQLAIRSMPNPFADHPTMSESVSYLVDELGVEASSAKKLAMKRQVSVMTMGYLKGKRKPVSLEEVQRLMKSLLQTMEFAHSRNIMHCDLHHWNYHWDGDKIYLFDWNGAFRYNPNKKLLIHYPRTPVHLFPPEAKDNTSAVHTSVYAFDVYTIGVILQGMLKSCCGITYNYLEAAAIESIEETKNRNSITTTTKMTFKGNNPNESNFLVDEALAYELALYMMLPDPYERPSTTEALNHDFFRRDIKAHQTSINENNRMKQ